MNSKSIIVVIKRKLSLRKVRLNIQLTRIIKGKNAEYLESQFGQILEKDLTSDGCYVFIVSIMMQWGVKKFDSHLYKNFRIFMNANDKLSAKY